MNRIKRNSSFRMQILLILTLSIVFGTSTDAQEYLSGSEVAKISGATIGLNLLSHHIRRMDTTRTPLINGYLPMDRFMQKLIGGDFKPGPCNFIDTRFGSAITPITTGALLLVTNISYPQQNKSKDSYQDLFLFTSGLLATKAITGFAKGIVTRPRPYMKFAEVEKRKSYGFLTDRSSFFSGHTSSAFFSVTYLNLRIRHTMRSEMNTSDYRNWKWAPSSILFGWASLVGFSRIHAQKHYFTDIVIGSLTGYLLAELFYSFNNYEETFTQTTGISQQIFRINFKI